VYVIILRNLLIKPIYRSIYTNLATLPTNVFAIF